MGGAYRVRFRSRDGREHEASGTVLELVPQRRIVMTYQYTHGDEPAEQGRTTRVEFEVVASAGSDIESTVVVIPVRRWSEGSLALPPEASQFVR